MPSTTVKSGHGRYFRPGEINVQEAIRSAYPVRSNGRWFLRGLQTSSIGSGGWWRSHLSAWGGVYASVATVSLGLLIRQVAPVPFDWFIWIVISLAAAGLAVCAFASGLKSSSPAFYRYLIFIAFHNTFCFSAWAIARNLILHYFLLVAGSLIDATLMALIVRELWRKTIGPIDSIPQRSAVFFVGSLAAIYPTCCAVLALFHAHTLSQWLNVVLDVEFIVKAASGATLSAILICCYRLGIATSKKMALLATGLVLTLCVDAVTVFVSAQFNIYNMLGQRIGQVTYLLSLGIWAWALWEKEPVILPASGEEVKRILAHHQQTLEFAEEIIDPIVTV